MDAVEKEMKIDKKTKKTKKKLIGYFDTAYARTQYIGAPKNEFMANLNT